MAKPKALKGSRVDGVLLAFGRRLVLLGGGKKSGPFPLQEPVEHAPEPGAAWTAGPKLGAGLRDVCAIPLDEASALVVGGRGPDQIQTDAAFVVDARGDAPVLRQPERLPVRRTAVVACRLASGRVLVSGGLSETGGDGMTARRVDVFEVVGDRWSSAPEHLAPRLGHALVALGDGRILALGGQDQAAARSSELFDGDAWRPGAALDEPRVRSTATLLRDGRVLVVGGGNGAAGVASTALWSPEDRWTAGPPLHTARGGHQAFALRDGGVIVVGGHGVREVERYDPETDRWEVIGALEVPRRGAAAALVAGGALVCAGGVDTTSGKEQRTVEVLELGVEPAEL